MRNLIKKAFSSLKTISKPIEPNYQIAGFSKPLLYKIVGHKNNKNLSPIVSYDHMYDKLPLGYPDHPHRGFQTISYYVSGANYHEDDLGYSDLVEAGDVHLQTMGKGCVHSEMPSSFEDFTIGFQLWIDLPKEKKYMNPNYTLFKKNQVPEYKEEGILARLISGDITIKGSTFNGIAKTEAEFFYLDIIMDPKKSFKFGLPKQVNGLIFCYQGDIVANNEKITELTSSNFYYTDSGTEIELSTENKFTKVVVLGGKPLNQPVVYDSLHVLNSEEELRQTIEDVKNKRNGFERIWKSNAENLLKKKN